MIEISARLGWANPTSFITAFTSLVGQTPGRYQQAVSLWPAGRAPETLAGTVGGNFGITWRDTGCAPKL